MVAKTNEERKKETAKKKAELEARKAAYDAKINPKFLGGGQVSREQYNAAKTTEPQTEQEKKVVDVKQDIAATSRGITITPQIMAQRQAAEGDINTAVEPISQNTDPNAITPEQQQARDLSPQPIGSTLNDMATTATGTVLSPLTNVGAAIGNFMSEKTGMGSYVSPEEVNSQIAETKVGKALAAAIVAGGAFVVGAEALALLPSASASVTGASVAGTSLKLGTITKGILSTVGTAGLLGGGWSLYNFKGGQINSYKQVIGDISTQASKSREIVSAGGDPIQELKNLEIMEQKIMESEAAIKAAGTYNLKFRGSKEYLDVQERAAEARAEIRRSTLEIKRIMLSGKPTLDPTRLIYTAEGY